MQSNESVNEEAFIVALALDRLSANTLTALDFTCTVNALDAEGVGLVAAALRTNTSLTALQLHGAGGGDRGARWLARALAENETLTVLDCRSNEISDAGVLALADTLRESNRTLTSLGLRHNELGEVGGAALLRALSTNTVVTALDLTANTVLNCDAPAELERAIVDALNANTLPQQPAMRTARPLARLIAVNNAALHYAELCSTHDPHDPRATARHPTRLVCGNSGARIIAEALRSNTHLLGLSLRDCDVGDAGVEAITHALRETARKRSLQAMPRGVTVAAVQTLVSLGLSDNIIGDDGAELLSGVFGADGVALTALCLEGNCIGPSGLACLANALYACGSDHGLIDLNLKGNPCGDSAAGSSFDGMRALAALLQHDTCLTKLDLRYSGVGNDSLAMLARSLRRNCTLTSLQHTVKAPAN
eukprot:g1555.t1